jgi:hypothetical protein
VHRVSIFKLAFCNNVIRCIVADVKFNTAFVSGE